MPVMPRAPIGFVDNNIDYLHGLLNVPVDQLRIAVCLILAVPLGFGFRGMKNATVRQLFSLIPGLIFHYIIYRQDMIFSLLMGLFTYYALKFFGRNHAELISAVCMAYLSIFHIYRMIVDWGANNIDIGVVLMIFVCKCTSFVWCYHDGGKEEEALTKEQMRKRIVKLPSLIDYLSFLYMFGNSLAGPACEYIDHDDWIHLRGDYAKSESAILPSLGYFLSAILTMLPTVFLTKKYNPDYCTTAEYASFGWWYKFYYVTVAMQVARCKYYLAWLFGNAAVTSAGLNYNPNGKNWREKFGKIVAVRPLDYEFEDNVKNKLEAWNTPTQIWLKNYVYFRHITKEEASTNPSKAARASNITFMTSAFWHGFYPGYYIAFFWSFLGQQTARHIYRVRSKFSWIPEPIAWFLRWFLSMNVGNFVGITFMLLDGWKVFAFYRAMNFVPNIVAIGFWVAFTFTSLGKLPKDKAKKTEGKTTEGQKTATKQE